MCLSLSIDSHHCTDFSLHPNLGQQSLTWCLKFAYPHTHHHHLLNLFFFLYAWTGRVPLSQCLLLLVVPHFPISVRLLPPAPPSPIPLPPPPPPSLIPSCPWRKTKLARLFNEEQSSERGERARFPHVIEIQRLPPKSWVKQLNPETCAQNSKPSRKNKWVPAWKDSF